MGFISNTGPDPLKNQKATKPAFIIEPSSARKRNAISMALRWRANDGPFIMVFGYSHQLKNVAQNWTPLTKLSGSAHGADQSIHCHMWLYGVSVKMNQQNDQWCHFVDSFMQ